MRNLSLLIQQILKQFDIAREELELSSQQISQETIQSIAEVLSLDIIDQNLMEDLGDFFFQISQKKKENFVLISQYCGSKSSTLIDKLRAKLDEFTNIFEDIKSKISPTKALGILESRQMSQNSAFEEDKQGDVMMIDTHLSDGFNRSASKGPTAIKLQEEDEK